MTAGSHRIVFMIRNHLYLVAVSALNEPHLLLERQLKYLHAQVLNYMIIAHRDCQGNSNLLSKKQILAMLTSTMTDKIFNSRNKYESKNLFGGTTIFTLEYVTDYLKQEPRNS